METRAFSRGDVGGADDQKRNRYTSILRSCCGGVQQLVGEDAGAEVVAVEVVIDAGVEGVLAGVAGEEGCVGEFGGVAGRVVRSGFVGVVVWGERVGEGGRGEVVGVAGFEGEGHERGGEEEEDAEGDCFDGGG